MPYKSNNTSKQAKRDMGDPAGTGVGGMKDINAENSLANDELAEKYIDENGEPNIGGANTGSHPNRNTNKPNINKPPYG